MIIDTHVHIFPDAIAERAISKLVQACYQTPNTNGTVSDTLRKIDEWGIDKIWALGVSTNAKQVHNVNAFLNSIRSDRIEPLGSLYPYSENVMDDLKEIEDYGLKGIKLHPEYSKFNPADERIYPMYEEMEKAGLVCLFHAGYDVAFPGSYLAAPKNIATVAKMFPKLKIVAAHLGGYESGDDIIYEEVGCSNIYVDTALMHMAHKPDHIKKLFDGFGPERILFATDCPWSKPSIELDILNSLNIDSAKKELILHKNAESLIK